MRPADVGHFDLVCSGHQRFDTVHNCRERMQDESSAYNAATPVWWTYQGAVVFVLERVLRSKAHFFNGAASCLSRLRVSVG